MLKKLTDYEQIACLQVPIKFAFTSAKCFKLLMYNGLSVKNYFLLTAVYLKKK